MFKLSDAYEACTKQMKIYRGWGGLGGSKSLYM